MSYGWVASMNKSWIHEQTERNISQFDKAMEVSSPESRAYIHDPKAYLSRISEQCNYLDAVKLIDWKVCLRKDCAILDLGCGGGWLTGYLSRLEEVKTVYALDSSKYFLLDMMPQIVRLMGGRQEKIVPIEGLFAPLMFDDGALDIVVASSVLHHADSLESVLKEMKRVLKSDGLLVILNETPSSGIRHVVSLGRAFIKIFLNAAFHRYKSISPSISSSGYLYDPMLGDRDYPLWYWKEAVHRSGFVIVESMDTGLSTVKNVKGRSLVHFVCRAA
ncbi:MAG: class I SAM-dependent methyltransferase [Nitrospira sp.]|nr:MAG: class I SAM-dependent methyltransferase [Nitrospira sp.]